MEWPLGDHWPGVYAITRRWVQANYTVMTTTNWPTLALLVLHTMVVVPCLYTGRYHLFTYFFKYWLHSLFQSISKVKILSGADLWEKHIREEFVLVHILFRGSSYVEHNKFFTQLHIALWGLQSLLGSPESLDQHLC